MKRIAQVGRGAADGLFSYVAGFRPAEFVEQRLGGFVDERIGKQAVCIDERIQSTTQIGEVMILPDAVGEQRGDDADALHFRGKRGAGFFVGEVLPVNRAE